MDGAKKTLKRSKDAQNKSINATKLPELQKNVSNKRWILQMRRKKPKS